MRECTREAKGSEWRLVLCRVQGGHKAGLIFLIFTRYSCSIHDETTNTLVITGGYYTLHNVSRYDTLGYLEELPSLINARWNHACGAYLREDNTQVESKGTQSH